MPVITGLADALSVPDGGFTVDVTTGQIYGAGFAVSTHPQCEKVLTRPVTGSDLDAYILRHWDSLNRPGRAFGGWHNPDDGLVYLDVSTVVATEDEARALAERHGQIAYFDFAKGCSVPVSVPAEAVA